MANKNATSRRTKSVKRPMRRRSKPASRPAGDSDGPLTSLSIRGFRGIRELDIDGLKPLTVFTGDNGAGKSTCLEAAFLLFGRMNPVCAVPIQARRGLGTMSKDGLSPHGLFYSPLELERATLSSATLSGAELGLEILLEPSPQDAVVLSQDESSPAKVDASKLQDVAIRASLRFIAKRGACVENESQLLSVLNSSRHELQLVARGAKPGSTRALLLHPSSGSPPDEEDKRRYGDLRAAGREAEVLEVMRTIDPRVDDVEYLETSRSQYFRAKLSGGRSLPLGMLGAGATTAFRFAVSLATVQSGLIGIDEVENGIHHSRQPQFFRKLIETRARLGTQVVLATHSREALTAIVEAATEVDPENFAVVHLRRDDTDEVRATVIPAKDAQASIDLGYDLR